MPELTDLSVIRALCEKYDFALSKGFGQNFTSFWYRLGRYDGTDSSDTMVPNAVL